MSKRIFRRTRKSRLKIRRVKKYKIALAINLVGAFLCPSVKADKA
jgi:hypothetical protein